MRATVLEEAEREALAAELRLYQRILARREQRSFLKVFFEQDEVSRRIEARLRVASRMWSKIDHSRYDIPF